MFIEVPFMNLLKGKVRKDKIINYTEMSDGLNTQEIEMIQTPKKENLDRTGDEERLSGAKTLALDDE